MHPPGATEAGRHWAGLLGPPARTATGALPACVTNDSRRSFPAGQPRGANACQVTVTSP